MRISVILLSSPFSSGAFGADWTEKVLKTVMFPPLCKSTGDIPVSLSPKMEEEMLNEKSGNIKTELEIPESKSENTETNSNSNSGSGSELEAEKESQKGGQKVEQKEEREEEKKEEGFVQARFTPPIVTFVTGNAKKLAEVKDILLTYKTSFTLISEKVTK